MIEIQHPHIGAKCGGAKKYGVTADQYAPVGAALLWTLEKGLGPDFTPETKAAWTEAYTVLAGVMTGA